MRVPFVVVDGGVDALELDQKGCCCCCWMRRNWRGQNLEFGENYENYVEDENLNPLA